MKTDLIEIFQTIRAELQPYATLDFTNRINSEEVYDLWTEKNIKAEGVTERFFAEVKIVSDHVVFRYSSLTGDSQLQDELKQLDDLAMKKIQEELSATFKVFKEQEWV
jgi:hypothetical protein